MDTLTWAPVADVLARLFTEAEVADGPLAARFAEEWDNRGDAVARLLEEEAADYQGVYHGFADNFLSISAELGRY